MLLRPRQEQFVARALAALDEHGNTLGVAPTGAGKTVIASAVIREYAARGARALVLQHRDELVAQNRMTFHRFAGHDVRSSIIDGQNRDPHGSVVFAMVQSLAQPATLELLRLRPFDLVVTDETHHSAAKTYRAIYDRARELNASVRFFGVTATPGRADRKSLRGTYSNVCDVITLGELIRSGHLVRPRTQVVDIGTQEALSRVRRTAADFDMEEVAAIMDTRINNESVVQRWLEQGADRQTVVFCANVAHGRHLTDSFRAAGVTAEFVDGSMPGGERKAILAAFDQRKFRVLLNVMVLTEGWDCQPVSCIVLTRPSSSFSTMIQMVGRGLRKLDPARYPGVVKHDCLIMDFGTSILTHGTLDQNVRLEEERRKGAAILRTCPDCQAQVPAAVRSCPICGHEFQAAAITDRLVAEGDAGDFSLVEIDILNASPFRWESLWDGSVMIATSFSAWAMAVCYGGLWYAVGGNEADGVRMLEAAAASSLSCLAAADDFLRLHGSVREAGKAKQWLLLPPTDKQIAVLRLPATPANMTRYQAACYLTWKFHERAIRKKIMDCAGRIAA